MILQDLFSEIFKAISNPSFNDTQCGDPERQIKEDSDKKGQSQYRVTSMWAASLLRGLRPFLVSCLL